MLTIELMGGLGNQLFQIFTLIAYSKKYNQPFLIEKKESLPGQYVVRNVYWTNLLDKLSHRLINNTLQYPLIREKSFEYEELPRISQDVNKSNHFKLYGYFQSYKYFQEYINDILNDIEWKTKRDNVLQKVKIDYNVNHMISLHFRVGDYTKLQDYHPLMPLEYYINAIKCIQTHAASMQANAADKQANAAEAMQAQILYFCEDNDIEYVTNTYLNPLKNEFPLLMFVSASQVTMNKLEDWEQMILMSACKHHIIANSSYSWWGAYLAYVQAQTHVQEQSNAGIDTNTCKIVCYPDKWFGALMGNKKTDDLFPSTWIKCETGIGKYALENVYYINLEERKDRKDLVESELTKMKWKYERFNAIRLNDGRVGCSMSHLKLLEMAKAKNLEYIVIVEDDIQFMKPELYNLMLSEFNRFMKTNKIEYDVLLIAGNLRPPIARVTNFITRIFKSWTTTGYIVKRHYYDIMINNVKEGVNKMMKNPQIKGQFEIDSYWQQLQAKDRWYILSPRTVTQRPNFSTIENRYTDYNYLMLDKI